MAVKANGKVLREFNNSVYIPFGSEYSIYLKNLSNIRVRVGITIDGEDVLDGSNIIIDKKGELELKRYIKNGNLERGNGFKFIEKTAAISNHRGDKAEDGLITVSYEFEKPTGIAYAIGGSTDYTKWSNPPTYSPYNGYPHSYHMNNQAVAYNAEVNCNDILRSATKITSTVNNLSGGINSTPRGLVPKAEVVPVSDPVRAGVTAPGAINEQKFVMASYFHSSGVVENMTMQLLGQVGEVEVTLPVAVLNQVKCKMCGKKARQTDKFCSQCGASVQIV